jgi:hypothetical protein
MNRYRHHLQKGSLLMFVWSGALLLSIGCTSPFAPRIAPRLGIPEPPPVPNQPEEVVRLFAWCWNHRAYAEYTEIFTDDFRFQFAQGDSAGNPFRDQPVDREEELQIARHLFVGGGSEPPANRIVLTIDPTLNASDDSRNGKDGTYHKEIFTNIDLDVTTDTQNLRVQGPARFFVVRGDSALIPQELKDKGFGPDPNRWYIEQYNDETFVGMPSTIARRVQGALRQAGLSSIPGATYRVTETGTSSSAPRAPGSRAAYDFPDQQIVTLGYVHESFR